MKLKKGKFKFKQDFGFFLKNKENYINFNIISTNLGLIFSKAK